MSARGWAAAALGLLAACGPAGENRHAPERTVNEQAAAVPVRTTRAEGGQGRWLQVPGTVEAARSASLASRVAATIRSLAVEEGARVRKGDLVVTLDGRDVAAGVEAAEARLKAARAQRDRIRTLLAKDAATRREMEAAEADFAAAAAEVEGVRSQLDYIEIRAPFDGRIAARRLQAGDMASPGHEIVLLEAAGLRRVAASVSDEQIGRLASGQKLTAILEGGSRAECAISVISPAGDPASRRFLLKCDLPSDVAARSGAFARLELPAADGAAGYVAVPATAVFERGGLTGLFVAQEGVARLRWIDPGALRDGHVEVRAGLAAGEEVILEPGSLTDGAAVTATPEEAER